MKKIIAKGLVLGLLVSQFLPQGMMEVDAAKKKIKLNKKNITIQVKKSFKLKVKHAKKKAKFTWKSKNKKIATVNKKGKVTAKKVGHTKVTCVVKQGKKKTKLTCKVKVIKRKVPQGPKEPIVSQVPAAPTPAVPTPAAPVVTSNVFVTQAPIPSATPTTKPGEDYHINWKSTYTDDYFPLSDMTTSFKLGTAIAGNKEETSALYDIDMVGILQKHYNSTTLTNLMKPVFLLDEEASKTSSDGTPVLDFSSCDRALKFCQDTGIQMRGHVLVWYNQTPDWFFCEDYDEENRLVDKATMQKRMESYIKQVITYVQTNYPGVVYCWDVVNEAVEDDGSIRSASNMWYKVYSEGNSDYAEYEYVKDAFTYAKKYANPDVALVYNDYNTFKPEKWQAIIEMIQTVNEDETLIDTVGMQCPILPSWPAIRETDEVIAREDACVEHAIKAFSEAGLDIMITELCVRTDGGNTKKEMEVQAERYREMYQLLYDMDVENGGQAQITSVTTFGIADSYRLYPESSWQSGDQSRYGWLFDKNCKAKLAFKCVYNVFAKATGKPAVEETYEKPEGEEEGVTSHVVSGTIKMKNGEPAKNMLFYFVSEDEMEEFYTDEEGKYSVSLDNGDWMMLASGYRTVEDQGKMIPLTANAEEEITYDVNMSYSMYVVEGKVVSQNGVPITEEMIFFYHENGEDIAFVSTDKNGCFSTTMREGNYSSSNSPSEGIKLVADKDYVGEDSITITMPKNIYVISGNVDLGEMLDAKKDMTIYLTSEKERVLISSKAKGTYSEMVSEGVYHLTVSTNEYDSEMDEDISDFIYYGQVEVSGDMTYDILGEGIRPVTVETDSLEGAAKINQFIMGGMYEGDTQYCRGDVYVAMETGTIEASCYDTLEDGKIAGIYSVKGSFDGSNSEKAIVSDGIVRMDVPIQEGEMQTMPMSAVSVPNAYSGQQYYQFVPKESGKYEMVIELSDFDAAEESYVEFDCSCRNDKMEYLSWSDYICLDKDGTEVLTFDCEFEKDKCYYFRAMVYMESETGNGNLSVGIRKAEN